MNYSRKKIFTDLSERFLIAWDHRKMMLVLMLLGAATATSREKVVITPANPGVPMGTTLRFKANVPVSWSLTGVGSLSGETSTTVAYTAPASITVGHSMAGCPVMPNDSIFNTRIDNLPVNPNSDTWLSGVVYGNPPTTPVRFGELGWGISTSFAGTPTRNLVNYYGGATAHFPIPSGPNLKEENGSFHSKADNFDHHIMNVRTDTCEFFELYNLHSPEAPDGNGCNGGVGSGCNVQASVSYGWSDYATNNGVSGTDAGSLPLAPLTMHLSEFYGGSINHPLRFTSCLGCIYHGTFLWPAGTSNGSTNTKAPPMGARFRLRLCGEGVTTKCVTASNYSPYQQIVLTALHNYGMILADIGSMTAVSAGADISLDRSILNAVDTLGIPIGDFEVVDESSLQYASGSYETCPFEATCTGPKNTYERPANQAILSAKPSGGGETISIAIAIQGVTIGLTTPDIWMVAGPYSYQIPSWVNGTSNQNVTWSLISGSGSVTPGGLYTPPQGTTELATHAAQFELGLKFKSDSSGYITGIRFYKHPSSAGKHTGTLWRCADQACSSGRQLATGTFTETKSGWQDVQFSSPVAITANTLYVASYHEADGTFLDSSNFFALAGVSNPPLHALKDGAAGKNGVFVSGSGGAFPNASNVGNNYWVDVDFAQRIHGTISHIFSAGNNTPAVSKTAMLKVTSAADSNAVAYEQITLLPPGYNPAGSVRIDSGNYSGTLVDGNGNVWQPESALENTSPGCCGEDTNPGWRSADPEIKVYETMAYGNGSTNDMQYTVVVPNGNYRVKAMYGSITGPPGTISQVSPRGETMRLHLETQGNIVYHNWNYLLNEPAGYTWKSRVPSYVYIPAKVTNNILEFASRAVFYDTDLINGFAGCQGCTNNTINGIAITPDSTPPHWVIDTQQQSTVNSGMSTWEVQTSTAAQSFELGTAFVPTTSGYIIGIRFYKSGLDTGLHTGSLWINNGGPFGSQTGTLLATGKFTGETGSGWQSLTFRKPVAVSAGTQYVVSYHTTKGILYHAPNLFTQPLVQPFINGPLQAFLGLFAGGSGGVFPRQTTPDAFAVDPIFSQASGGTKPVGVFQSGGTDLPGQQLQLYVQDWYTGVNDPQWSIVSGPGTITKSTDISNEPCAVYTAPNKVDPGASVTIKAQSASNPSISATVTLHFTQANQK